MFLQGRVIVVWLTWLLGGICGVVILLVIICYCRQMPRHQKSFDEQYLKDTYMVKETQTYSQEHYKHIVKHEPPAVHRHARPASYAGGGECRRGERPPPPPPRPPRAPPREPSVDELNAAHYASSSMLDELEAATSVDALKTRSLPAFLRPRPRPLSTDDDLHHLYAKAQLSKKYKSRMRSEHAAIIALSKSRSQRLDHHDAVIVIDQRTQL